MSIKKRWQPISLEKVLKEKNSKINFIEGIITVCGSGSATERHGMSINYFLFNSSMNNNIFENSDGEILIVVQQGKILITTELGEYQLNQTLLQ